MLSPGSLIARGRTAEVFAWQANQVCKLFYAWCPLGWIQHEIEVVRVVASMSLPIPRLIDTVEIEGRRGIIYERVDGPSLLSVAQAKPWLLFHLARQFAELHSEVHKRAGNGLLGVRASLSTTIRQVATIPPDLKTDALSLLASFADDNKLCHGDFHPGQVLMTSAGPVIIDWMTAQQGHPLADVARTTIILTIGKDPHAGQALRAFINLWRGLFYRTYLARYLELHPGYTMNEIRIWMVPMAAGRLKEDIQGEQEQLLAYIRSHKLTQ
jgi:aminoglycoside phosphotransferase (APT) family kinase protein